MLAGHPPVTEAVAISARMQFVLQTRLWSGDPAEQIERTARLGKVWQSWA